MTFTQRSLLRYKTAPGRAGVSQLVVARLATGAPPPLPPTFNVPRLLARPDLRERFMPNEIIMLERFIARMALRIRAVGTPLD